MRHALQHCCECRQQNLRGHGYIPLRAVAAAATYERVPTVALVFQMWFADGQRQHYQSIDRCIGYNKPVEDRCVIFTVRQQERMRIDSRSVGARL